MASGVPVRPLDSNVQIKRVLMADKKTVQDLLDDEIKDLYSAEKQPTKAISEW
jgi:hypothetical protein